jgi:hypothetical protein
MSLAEKAYPRKGISFLVPEGLLWDGLQILFLLLNKCMTLVITAATAAMATTESSYAWALSQHFMFIHLANPYDNSVRYIVVCILQVKDMRDREVRKSV